MIPVRILYPILYYHQRTKIDNLTLINKLRACNDKELYAGPVEPDASAEGNPVSAHLVK